MAICSKLLPLLCLFGSITAARRAAKPITPAVRTRKPAGVMVLSHEPRIYYYPRFITDEEADELMNFSGPLLRPTMVSGPGGSHVQGQTDHSSRVSDGVFLNPLVLGESRPVLSKIRQRVSRATKVPSSNFEHLQVGILHCGLPATLCGLFLGYLNVPCYMSAAVWEIIAFLWALELLFGMLNDCCPRSRDTEEPHWRVVRRRTTRTTARRRATKKTASMSRSRSLLPPSTLGPFLKTPLGPCAHYSSSPGEHIVSSVE